MTIIPLKDDAHWHELRRQYIGSSEVAALFGEQPGYAMSLYTLWMVKAGRLDPPSVENERTKWGIRLESVIAEAIGEMKGWGVIDPEGYYKHPAIEGMGCTIDRLISDDSHDTFGVLELKNVDYKIWKQQWTGDEPPIHTILQLQHQLACTGLSWGAIGGLVGGNHPEAYVYEARPKTIAAIERAVTKFWASIKANQPPQPDGTDSTTAALKALYPESLAGKVLDLTQHNEFPEIVAELKQSRLDERAAGARKKAAENRIYNIIEDAELVMSDGMEILTAKTRHRKGYTVKDTTYREIRLKESV